MDEQQALDYLNTEHEKHFIKKVTLDTLKRWYRTGKITEFTESELDRAVLTNKIPPKRGRPRTITQEAIDNAIAMIESGESQSKAAAMFGLSASMLSRIRRNQRRETDT